MMYIIRLLRASILVHVLLCFLIINIYDTSSTSKDFGLFLVCGQHKPKDELLGWKY